MSKRGVTDGDVRYFDVKGRGITEFTPFDGAPGETVEIVYKFWAHDDELAMTFPSDDNLKIVASLSRSDATCIIPTLLGSDLVKFTEQYMPELGLPDDLIGVIPVSIKACAKDPSITANLARSYLEYVSKEGYDPVVERRPSPREAARMREIMARNEQERATMLGQEPTIERGMSR